MRLCGSPCMTFPQIEHMQKHGDGAVLAVVCKSSGDLAFEPQTLSSSAAASFINGKLKMSDFDFETGLEAHVLSQKAAAAAPTLGINQDYSRQALKAHARDLLRAGLRECFFC